MKSYKTLWPDVNVWSCTSHSQNNSLSNLRENNCHSRLNYGATSGVHRHHKEQCQWTSHRLPHHGLLAGLGKVSYRLDQYGNKCMDKRPFFWQFTVCCHRRGAVWHHKGRVRSFTGINRGTLSLFTDDTIAYLTLSIESNTLKENINKLATLEEKWMMQFNSGKCVVLPITKRKNQYKQITSFTDRTWNTYHHQNILESL